MPDISARLSLPFIQPSQAQKHVTHNEALLLLDLLAQLTVEEFGASTPPGAPLDGQVWALASVPTSAWAGHGDELAAWFDGAWLFIAPQEGWRALGKADLDLRIWDGSDWDFPALPDLNNLNGVGVNTSFDPVNRLSVASAATLLSHEGAGHQLKINKALDTDTASLLFQTNWSGRAEMGAAGSDDFSIKVSPDGGSWFTGLSFDRTSGEASAPNGMVVSGTLSGTAVTQNSIDSTAGRLLKVGDFGLGASSLPSVVDLDASAKPGFYRTTGTTTGVFPAGASVVGKVMVFGYDQDDFTQFYQSVMSDDVFIRRYHSTSGGVGTWNKIWDTSNTTVDGNGFIKEASPIIQLRDDGITEPAQPVGAKFTKLETGKYSLSGVNSLAEKGWQIEVPQDSNGNRLVFVETDYDASNQVLTVQASEVIWDGRWVAGGARDIPAGRWIDLRFTQPVDVDDDIEMPV